MRGRVPQTPLEGGTQTSRTRRRLGIPGFMRVAIGDESGQSLLEYALIASLVSVVAIAALSSIGGSVTNFLSTLAGNV